MSLRYQKRLAARLLNVGATRIWIDPERADDVLLAVTGADMRKLVADGAIRRKPATAVSRGRKRVTASKKKRGLQRGAGSRKGHVRRRGAERSWVSKVRSQRSFIAHLRRRKVLAPGDYRTIYRLVKGAAFQNIPQIKSYVGAHKLAKR